jgi:hypothetical protein
VLSGVLPACAVSSAVPEAIQGWLNIDFVRVGKIRSGGIFRRHVPARQILPPGGNSCRVRAAIYSTFHKSATRKAAQMLEKPGSRRHSGW